MSEKVLSMPAIEDHTSRAKRGAARISMTALASFARHNALLFVFFGLVLIGAATSEYFVTVSNLTNLMRSMAVPGLLALGVTFVLLVGRIDLSMGSLMIFAPIVGIATMILTGDIFGFDVLVRANSYVGSAAALVIVTVLTGLLVGLVNASGVLYARVASFIMTLAMMQALRGLNYVLTDGHAYYIQLPSYTWMGTTDVLGVPFSFLVYAAASIVAAMLLRYTLVGRRFYAIGGDEKAAKLAGINVRFWIAVAFAINGTLAGIAGILFTSRLQSVDAPMGVGFELTAIAFAVVGGVSLRGGRGSPYRAFLGALTISTLLNLFDVWGLNTWYQNIATGAIIILVVIFDRLSSRRRL